MTATRRLDAALTFPDRQLEPAHGDTVGVRIGDGQASARLSRLGGRFWQLRLESPLTAAVGQEVAIVSPAGGALGSGLVLDPEAPREGPTRDVIARLTQLTRILER
ncbi:MAG TPA: hypothetical protein VGN69_10240 [Solirubrobacteraceae bacterium]|jgi:selenocysteine-specific elongation factor|nr:hypothetical protein [Solirubrobacteraceae bacterium]